MSNVARLFSAVVPQSPVRAYVARVEAMDDDRFFEECKRVLLLAAFASTDPGSDFHWQHRVCVGQAVLRGRKDLYVKAKADQTAASMEA